ncbi:anoctamin-4-like isoform X2 [Watersipora subatra]|uniref:anoctamin-4-like isoform X2 n=1 Tax=Watersipora subatra TaxID=2589382 RepID=UPI00355B7197
MSYNMTPQSQALGFEGMSQEPQVIGVYPRLSNPIGFEDSTADPQSPTTSQLPLQSYRVDDNEMELEAMESEKASLVKDDNGGYGGASSVNDVVIGINNADENEVPDRESLMFRDGERRIDYVLAYQDIKDAEDIEKREKFFEELKEKGVELEIEDKKFSQDMATYYCKVHMPWKLCLVYAEVLKIKMPIRVNDIDTPIAAQCCSPTGVFKPNVEEEEDFFTSPFFKDGKFIGYDGPDVPKPNFFSNAQRGRMVHEVLLRTRYGEEQQQFGVRRLFNQGIIVSYYPLHDGPYKLEGDGIQKPENKRQELYYEWARPGVFMKEQPYDAIRHYFGEKAGIYFSWLGFYTLMLVPASIVGIIVSIYGLATISSDSTSRDICTTNGDIIMCPQCDNICPYWFLNQSCLYSKATYVVDNPATIFFAIFMALWTTFFMEFWKRHQARLQYDWDVADFEENEQNIRPEYQAVVVSKKKNPITHDYEPHMPSLERCLRFVPSIISIFFLLCVVLAAILSVILYRIFIAVPLYNQGNDLIRSQASLITSVTAACISVVAIAILNKVYEKLAVFLTHLETWKYESEWEDAFTCKMYLFQFANYYGSIIYIAFFKGRVNGTPDHYMRTFGKRGEECDPAGCLIELAIQLGIVMVGNQAINNFKEIIVPMLFKFYKSRKGRQKMETDDDKYTRWERDFDLVDFPIHGLYEEYLEMVIQYGFVTLFVAAFPLAPFFALLNNIIEVRLDATKMVTQWKRPMAARAQDIGTWFYILQAVSTLAVLVNACIIAFTSDFIPRSIFLYTFYHEEANQTFVEWSLSSFRTEDFENASAPDYRFEVAMFGNDDTHSHRCHYRDYVNSPESSSWVDSNPNTHYIYTTAYWHILVARLAFILIFEHVVLGFSGFINFIIPDVPTDVKERTQREKHIAKVALHDRLNDEDKTNSTTM